MNDLTKQSELEAPVKANLAPIENAVFEINTENPEVTVSVMENAITVPIQANMEMWNPTEEKASMDGLLIGFVTLQMQSLSDSSKIEDVECAVLYTPRDIVDAKTGEIQGKKLVKVAIAAKRAVSFLKNVQPKTMWKIIYCGEQKNKNNQFKSKTFEFYQMIKG